MVSSQLPGIRSKTLIVMETLLRNELCQKQVAPVPNIIRTLRHVLPAVDDADKTVLLKILSSLLTREASIVDLCANDGMLEIVSMADSRDTLLSAEVLKLIKMVCSLGHQQRKSLRNGEESGRKDSVKSQPPSERGSGGSTMFFGRMFSGISEIVKSSNVRSRLPTLSDRNINEEAEQTKVAVLTAASLTAETTRRRAFFDRRLAQCEELASQFAKSKCPTNPLHAFSVEGDRGDRASEEDIVRVTMLSQGVVAFVLSQLSAAGDFKNLLSILEVSQLLLHESPSAQIEFAARGGYKALLNQLERFASSPDDALANESHAEAVYVSLTSQALFSSPSASPRVIENVFALHFFIDLVASSSPSLIRLGTRTLQLILKSNSAFVVDLEIAGATSSVCSALASALSGEHGESELPGHSSVQSSIPIPQANVFDTFFPELKTRSIPLHILHGHGGSPSSSTLPASGSPADKPSKSAGNTDVKTSGTYEDRMLIAIDLSMLLQHIAVITSMRDAQLLAFLSCLLYSSAKNMLSQTEFNGFSSKCQNCENASSQFECLHPTCIMECCFCVCAACDNVLHKAVVRRNHFRLPVNLSRSPRPCISLVDPALHSIIRTGFFEGMSLRSSQQQSLASLCTLLYGIRGLLDDRRARDQSIPGVLLEPLLMTQRALISLSSQSTAILSPSTVDSKFQKLLSRFADFRDDINLSPGESIEVEEPPEVNQLHPLRIAISLILQTVARYFFVEKIKTAEWNGKCL